MSATIDTSAVTLAVQIGSLALRNPILLASGTCGYGNEIARLVDLGQIGGVVTKTVTPRPRAGNPPPRIAEVPAGMLNSIGLENVGIDVFLDAKLPAAAKLDTCRVISVGGETVDDYVGSVERLDGAPGADAIELNLSCPNVSGGLDFSRDPDSCASLMRAVRAVTSLPVIAKLTPNVAAVAPIARAAADHGADAVSLVNTFLGMSIDVARRRAHLASVVGGLSGPAIRPLALAKVWEVSKAVDIPVIGIGGIADCHDVAEFLLAGASAIQVGTQNFIDPGGAARLADELAIYIAGQGFSSVVELRHAFTAPGP